MPESQLKKFGSFITSENWNKILEGENINEISNKFIDKVQNKVNEIFPTKSVKVPTNQKPWFNHKLKELSENKTIIKRG